MLQSYDYTYDNVGNILTVSGTENKIYTYDDLYRLKSFNGIEYEYDDFNNLISETDADGNVIAAYEYTGDNRLKSKTANGETITYEYDLAGNLIYDSTGNEYVYDDDSKLLYSKVNGVETYYEIGADGYRKSKTTDGIRTTYSLDENGHVLAERRGWNILSLIDKAVKKFLKDGSGILKNIVSIKSMDTTAKTYQNASKMRNKLRKYIDDLAGFSETTYKGTKWTVKGGTSRTLELAIPAVGLSKKQAKVLQEMKEYAKKLGITLKVLIVN